MELKAVEKTDKYQDHTCDLWKQWNKRVIVVSVINRKQFPKLLRRNRNGQRHGEELRQ